MTRILWKGEAGQDGCVGMIYFCCSDMEWKTGLFACIARDVGDRVFARMHFCSCVLVLVCRCCVVCKSPDARNTFRMHGWWMRILILHRLRFEHSSVAAVAAQTVRVS